MQINIPDNREYILVYQSEKMLSYPKKNSLTLSVILCYVTPLNGIFCDYIYILELVGL